MENPQIYIPWPIRARAHHRNRGTVVKDRGSSRGAADLAVGTSPPSLMVTERPEDAGVVRKLDLARQVANYPLTLW